MSEQLISTIDGKYLYAKSAASADVASKDEKGNAITGTYATTTALNSLGEWVGNTINSMQTILQPLPYTKQDVSGMTAYQKTADMGNFVSTGQWADVTAGKQDKTAMTAYATTGDLAEKQDKITYGYNAGGQITAIDSSALAGGGSTANCYPLTGGNLKGQITASGAGGASTAQSAPVYGKITALNKNNQAGLMTNGSVFAGDYGNTVSQTIGVRRKVGTSALAGRFQLYGDGAVSFQQITNNGAADSIASQMQYGITTAGVNWGTMTVGTETKHIAFTEDLSGLSGKSGDWDSTYTTVSNNSANWGQGGGGSYTSPNETVIIRGETLEGTDKALVEGESQSANTLNPNGYSIGGSYLTHITDWSQYLPDVPVTITYSSDGWVQEEGLCFQFKDNRGNIVNGPELPFANFAGTGMMTGLYGNDISARVAYVDPGRADYPMTWITVNGLTARTDAFEVVELEHKIDYGYDSTGAITSMNGSAIGGQGGKTYEGVDPIVVDNDEGKISAVTLQITHDDTLVHQSNNSVYALGVNMSAMPGYETVLWSSTTWSTATKQLVLSEALSNFQYVKIYGSQGCMEHDASASFFFVPMNYMDTTPAIYMLGTQWTNNNTSLDWSQGGGVKFSVTAKSALGTFNNWNNGAIKRVVGINRTAGGN